MNKVVDSLLEKYPKYKLKGRLNEQDRLKWIMESKGFAEDYAYKGLKYNQEYDEKYIERGAPVVQEQLAIAGYRLADSLEETF